MACLPIRQQENYLFRRVCDRRRAGWVGAANSAGWLVLSAKTIAYTAFCGSFDLPPAAVSWRGVCLSTCACKIGWLFLCLWLFVVFFHGTCSVGAIVSFMQSHSPKENSDRYWAFSNASWTSLT